MDEEEAVKNVTRKIENKIKSKSKKGEKNQESSMGLPEAQNINAVEAIEHAVLSGEGDKVERKRDQKKLKKKKNKEGEVAEADIKKGTEGELTVAYGSGDTVVNVDKKRKKTEKKKKNKEGEVDEADIKKGAEGELTVAHGSGDTVVNVDKKRKKTEKKKKNKEGEVAEADIKKGAEGELTVAYGSGDTVVNVDKKRKKTEKKKKNKEGEVDEADIKKGAEGELTVAYGSGDTVVNVDKKRKKTEKKRKNKEGEVDEADIKKGAEGELTVAYGSGDTVVNVDKKRKKTEKKKKNKEGEVDEADIKKGAEGELTVADGSGDTVVNVEKKRKKTEKNKSMAGRFETSNTKEVDGNKSEKKLDGESILEIKSTEDANKERKKHKSKRKREDGDFDMEGEKDGKEGGQDSQNCGVHAMEILEKKKRKKEKKKSKDDIRCQDTFTEGKHDEGDLPSVQQENIPDNIEGTIESTKNDGNVTNELARKKKKKKKKNKKEEHYKEDTSGLMHTDKMQSNEVEHENKKKKKYTQLEENGSDDMRDNGAKFEKKGKLKETESVENGSNDATPNKSNKKVRFSGQDEFFPIPGDGDSNTAKGFEEEENLVRGKRFTREEDEIVKEAVLDYIQRRDLGDEGLDMVLNCKKHPEVRGCWKEIGSAIPYRPYSAVYYRAHILFRRSENRKWTQEEYDEILEYQEEHGNEWKALAEELGRHRFHVKDTWRRIKLSDRKTGHWSQDEYQKLFDLVNADLKLKLSEEKRSKHGMLRDNICWTAISDELSTRPQATCCVKWYKQLTSSMVSEGIWADADDYRLIDALYSLDATCVEDVDWDCLIDDRTGDVCRKRWNQMVLHIGRHGNNSFAEQVEVLAQRYCPNLLEARETWDSKPRVP